MPNRVEREIEEILSKLEPGPPPKRPIPMRRSWRARVQRRLRGLPNPLAALPAVNAGNMMLLGIGLILSALLLRMFSGTLAYWAVVIGFVLFVLSFILSLRRGGSGGGVAGPRDVYWRGQRVSRAELRGPTVSERVRTWWRGRNRGR